MSGRYTVSSEIYFSASHALAGYNGDCARVHGHNWAVRVYYEFDRVDEQGLTVDYRKLRSELERVIFPRFDHQHLNDISPFDYVNPTSENIAAEIFRLCKNLIEIENGVLREVELWETPADMVRYREES
jgi:6-pyruvoyltetrahydropterin/6-carboxytetrahydropterin synthase